jgi:pilus assembly protein Flp/PilA
LIFYKPLNFFFASATWRCIQRASALLGRISVIVIRVCSRLLLDDSGVTAIEYGLIAALIAVACVVVWGQVGTDLSSTFTTVASNL